VLAKLRNANETRAKVRRTCSRCFLSSPRGMVKIGSDCTSRRAPRGKVGAFLACSVYQDFRLYCRTRRPKRILAGDERRCKRDLADDNAERVAIGGKGWGPREPRDFACIYVRGPTWRPSSLPRSLACAREGERADTRIAEDGSRGCA